MLDVFSGLFDSVNSVAFYGRAGLSVQADADWRRFDGLRWDGSPLPSGWPRSIDVSTRSVALGWPFWLTGPAPGDVE